MSSPNSDLTDSTTGMPPPAAPLEMASVLFMDIVGYSLEPMERQSSLLASLQQIVRATPEFQRAQERNLLISLPTGDGMALVFFENPLVPVECAVSVCKALKSRSEIKLRMGIHAGPVYRITDINAAMNVAGSGINMAQRVMDCGDAGHVLVSSAVADVLRSLSGWSQYVKDLGEHQVKHGVKLHIFAICVEDVQNIEIPKKLRAAAPPPKRFGSKWLIGGALAALLIAGVGAALFATRNSADPQSPPSAAAPAPERSLGYWVTVQKYRNGKPSQAPFRLAKDINFEADYRIRLGFSSPQSGYLYLINEGPVRRSGLPDYHMLFPSPTTNNGSAEVKANAPLQIPPAESAMIRFDDEQGTEKLWMVWAKDDLPELAAAKRAASFRASDGGAIQDPIQVAALQKFLAKHAAAPPRLEEDEAGKQTVLRGSGDVLVYLRKLEHH